jgi:hypothetical protein
MAGKVFSSWDPIVNPVTFYLLCGQMSPGIVTITGMNQPRRIQELMGPGSSGSTAVYRGWKPSHFSASHLLTTPEDWFLWDSFKTLLKLPARGQQGAALEFWHPFGNLYDPPIRSVIVEDVLCPVTNDNGSETIEVKYVQYQKRSTQYSKPMAAKETPKDALDIENEAATRTLERKRAEADALRGKPAPS